MNAWAFYVCPHCKKEHGNPARAAICCLIKNQRWYCTACGKMWVQRDRADAVLRLPSANAEQQGPEEQREALDPHAHGLGRGEVAGLVQDDQGREAQEGENEGHRVSVAAESPAV